MMAITTKSSISVKPRGVVAIRCGQRSGIPGKRVCGTSFSSPHRTVRNSGRCFLPWAGPDAPWIGRLRRKKLSQPDAHREKARSVPSGANAGGQREAEVLALRWPDVVMAHLEACDGFAFRS